MRQFIAFLLSFIVFSTCAAAETFAINAKSLCAVVDDSGKTVFDCSDYNIIFMLKNKNNEPQGYAAGIYANDGTILYALLSPSGAKLTGHIYTHIESARSGFIAATRDRWYCLNARGSVIGESYSAIEYTGEGAYAVSGDPYDELSDDLLMLHPDGRTESTGINVQFGLGEFSEGLIPITSGENLLSGYMDASGSWVIEPLYSYAAPFINGVAIVSSSAGFGVINTDGAFIIEPGFSFMSRSENLFLGVKDDTAHIFSSDGALLSETPLDGASAALSGGSVIISSAESIRILSASGDLIFDLPADCAPENASSFFIVRTPEGAYIADSRGGSLSEKFHGLYHLEKDLFACGTLMGGSVRYGLYRAGEGFLTASVYDDISLLKDGLYAASSSEKLILVTQDGGIIPVR